MNPQGILKATTINMIGRFAASLLGFLQFVIIAKIFGIGIETDAFLIAQTIPLLFLTMSETVLGYSFLPVFIDCREKKGEDKAWELAGAFSTILNIILFVLTIILFVFAPYIVSLLAPGMSSEGHSIATILLRILSPVLLIVGISGLPATIFNSYQHFTIPALASLFLGLGVIVSTLLFAKSIGITAVALGFLGGLLLQAMVLVVALLRKKGSIQMSFNFNKPEVRQIVRLMGPRFLGLLMNRIDVSVDRIFASTLGSGYISALTYADRVIHFFCALIPIALGKSMMPVLSKHSALGANDEIKRLFTKAIGAISFIFIPLTVVLIILGNPLITLFFQREAFDKYAVSLTTTALVFFSIGLTALSFNIIIGGVFYSLQDTLTPLKAGAIGSILNVLLDALLIGILAHGGLALATSIVAIVRSVIMYRLLTKKIGPLEGSKIFNALFKTVIAATAMSTVMWFFKEYGMNTLLESNFLSKSVGIALTLSAGIVTYIFSCRILKISEYNDMVKLITKRIMNARLNSKN
jgi:putative peptidoglycan lipid II flippase